MELLIIGNGLSIDLFDYLNLTIHPSCPFSFPVTLPYNQKKLIDELIRLKNFLNLRKQKDDFVLIEKFIQDFDKSKEDHMWLHCELRHYLSLAYSYAYLQIKYKQLSDWKWTKWIHAYRSKIAGIVSLNYDLTIELILKQLSIDFFRIGSSEEIKGIPVFKPHGSCDFDINEHSISMPIDTRLKNLTLLNDGGYVDIVPENKLLIPRIEADIVLPFESSKQKELSWIRKGFESIKQISKVVTKCTIIGISYHQCDRNELDFIIDNFSEDIEINIVNTHPISDLKNKLSKKTVNLHEYLPKYFPEITF